MNRDNNGALQTHQSFSLLSTEGVARDTTIDTLIQKWNDLVVVASDGDEVDKIIYLISNPFISSIFFSTLLYSCLTSHPSPHNLHFSSSLLVFLSSYLIPFHHMSSLSLSPGVMLCRWPSTLISLHWLTCSWDGFRLSGSGCGVLVISFTRSSLWSRDTKRRIHKTRHGI